jgi:hypothetical protein
MFRDLHWLIDRYALLSPEGEGGGTGGGEGNQGGEGGTGGTQQDDDPLKGLTPEQRKAVDRHADSKAAAARRDTEAAVKQRIESEQAEKKRLEDESRERDEATKRGEFDKVKTSLEGERDTFKSQAETEKQRAERAIALLTGQIKSRVDALPDRLKDTFPKDADPLEQIEWLDDPRTVEAVSLATQQTGDRAEQLRGASGKPIQGQGAPEPDPARADAVKANWNRTYSG